MLDLRLEVLAEVVVQVIQLEHQEILHQHLHHKVIMEAIMF